MNKRGLKEWGLPLIKYGRWPVSWERDSFAKGIFSLLEKKKNRAAALESE
jgi:hypothetical protein